MHYIKVKHRYRHKVMHIKLYYFNALSDDKILHLCQLKGFADDKFDVVKATELVLEKVDNIVEKAEIAGF